MRHNISYASIEAVRVVANTDLALGCGALEEYYSTNHMVRTAANASGSASGNNVSCKVVDEKDNVPRLVGLGSCIQKLESGLFHAVVVVNACERRSKNGSMSNISNLDDSAVSLMSMEDYSEHPLMSGVLGSAVEAFVRHGGVAVFCAEESSRLLIGSLQYLFHVSWSGNPHVYDNGGNSQQDKDVWVPCKDNAERLVASFGALVHPCRMKVNRSSLDYESVPPLERCFVKASSLGHGNDNDDESNTKSQEMNGVCVAMHDYSSNGGAIAYFGDSECGNDMMDLVAAFIMMRSPSEPIKSQKVEMTEADFAEISKLKRLGNEAFRAENYQAAVDLYLDALCFYDTYSVKFNPHFVEEHLTLHALLSLCYIRMELWFDAQTCAESVLSFNPNHEESILRLATAAVGLVRSEKAVTKEWKISTLAEAKNNLEVLDSSLNPAVATEAAELSRTVQNMLNDLTL